MLAIFDYLQRPAVIRFQCLMLMYTTSIFGAMEREFMRMYGKIQGGQRPVSKQLDKNTKNPSPSEVFKSADEATGKPTSGQMKRLPAGRQGEKGENYSEFVIRQRSARRSKEELFGEGDNVRQWDCEGFIKLPKVLVFYQNLSTAWMSYVLVKFSGSSVFAWIIRLWDDTTPAGCYMLGRFVFAENLSVVCSILFCIYHLLWRSRVSLRYPVNLHLLHFLLQSDRDFSRFSGTILARDDENAIAKHEIKDNQLRTKTSAREEYFRSFTCYRVYKRSEISYCIRPNRTLEARQQLKDHLTLAVIVLLGFLGCVAIVIFCIITYLVLSDWRYVQEYAQCDAVIEAKNRRGELGWFGLTVTWKRMVSIFADAFENWIIWIDTGFTLIYGYILLYILNYDNLLYWRHLHLKIVHLLGQLRANHEAHNGHLPVEQEFCMLDASKKRLHEQPGLAASEAMVALEVFGSAVDAAAEEQQQWQWSGAGMSELKVSRARRSLKLRSSAPASNSARLKPTSLFEYNVQLDMDNSIFDLQSEMRDFFKLIETYDLVVSDVLTLSIIVWLITFALLNYHSLANRMADLPIQVHLTQSWNLVGFVGCSWVVLQLHRSCLRTYQVICSLMAYDQSRHKRSFLKILEFFTRRKRTMYTLFHQYPYSPTSFLSIVGWTFSCFFIMDSLFRYG